MQRQAAVLVAIVAAALQFAIAQSTGDTPQSPGSAVTPFLGQPAAIPEGYSLLL